MLGARHASKERSGGAWKRIIITMEVQWKYTRSYKIPSKVTYGWTSIHRIPIKCSVDTTSSLSMPGISRAQHPNSGFQRCWGHLCIFSQRTAPRTAHTLISRKIASAQWFWVVSVYSRAHHPDPTCGFQRCWCYLNIFRLGQLPEMPIPWFPGKIVSAQWFWAASVHSRAQHPNPDSGYQSFMHIFARVAPRTAYTLISRKDSFRAMILGRFYLFQSSASRS